MAKRNDPSAVVSGAGWIGGFVYFLERALLKRLTREQIHELVSEADPKDALYDSIVAIIVDKIAPPILQVAWSLVLPWIIAACRFVSYLHPDITAEYFPLLPDDLKIKEVKVVKPGRAMSTPDVLKWLDDQGLRPATLLELLWSWLTNPDAHKNCWVVALGQEWNGYVPYVDGYGDHRQLNLSRVADDWNEYYRFAVASK